MPDTEMEVFLNGVVGVVEANSFEHLCLWQENHARNGMLWVEGRRGFLPTVGNLDDMPICLSLLVNEVQGCRILFIYPTSQVVDHRLIDKWLLNTLPSSAFKPGMAHINKVDAMNFHNVFPRKAA